jgi:uncharacterized protein YoaH (UPF0181 family)
MAAGLGVGKAMSLVGQGLRNFSTDLPVPAYNAKKNDRTIKENSP